MELCVQVGPCVLWINFQVQAQTWTLKTSFSLHQCNFVVGWHLFQFSKCHAFCSNFEWSWASEVFWLAGFYFKGLSLTTWALNISVLCLTVSPRFLWLLGCLTSSTPNLHLEISSSVHQYNFCCWWWNRISCSRCHAFCSNLVSAWASLQMFGLTGGVFMGLPLTISWPKGQDGELNCLKVWYLLLCGLLLDITIFGALPFWALQTWRSRA